MVVPPDLLPPRPSLLASVLGAVRVVATVALAVLGTIAILLAALIPSAGGVRPAERVAVWISRACLAIAGVRRETHGAERLRSHRGFVFFNHVSYLDPVVLVATAPMRFLSTLGVRRLPLIGWMARALGTIFVHRGRDESRQAAREALREAVHAEPTPVAVAPEGKIGPGGGVLPFRHGAFEVARDADAAALLVGLRFEPHAYALWQDDEWIVAAYWRLCARTRPVTAVLDVLGIASDGSPASAAADAESRLARWVSSPRPELPGRPVTAR